MTDKLISDLTAIGAAIADNTATEVQRNGQTTTEQALGSDWKTYIKSWIAKADVALGNVANSLQLIAANNLSDLTDFVAAAGNIGLGFGGPKKRFYAFTDCIAFASNLQTDSFTCSPAGTASGISAVDPATNNVAGVLSLDLGTTTTGRSTLWTAIGGTASKVVRMGIGRVRFRCKINIPVLSNGTDTFATRVGFLDAQSGFEANAVEFRYTDGVNSGKWQAVTRDNSTETATDTGVVPVAGTFQELTIDVNAAGTSAVFAINGSTVATNTTNIPTASGRGLAFGIVGLKSLGTTATSAGQVDLIEGQLDFTSTR